MKVIKLTCVTAIIIVINLLAKINSLMVTIALVQKYYIRVKNSDID